GEVAAREGLAGKPAPDTYLHAARELGVEPGAAVVVEDATSGVAAGRAGEFGLVVGGEVAAREGLAGKPAPDTYLHAARELGVEPGAAVVVE
ncbi:HAD-IA family hydrolase, partial [Corynebacterium bovis]|uniref:HAD-IA family hydrolase n=1 Tax=Corynebacterium bovis TaxID=36808 RepID=UPI00313865B6